MFYVKLIYLAQTASSNEKVAFDELCSFVYLVPVVFTPIPGILYDLWLVYDYAKKLGTLFKQ